MPGTRLLRHFDIEGNELPPAYIEVSDEEILIEAIDSESRGANDDAVIWYSNIDNMGLDQLREVIKMLCGRYIAEHTSLYIPS